MRRPYYLASICITVALAFLLFTSAVLGADTSKQEQLLARMQQYIDATSASDWTEAEKIVVERDRIAFRNTPKAPMQSPRIVDAQIDPDGTHATVKLEVTMAADGVPIMMPVARMATWEWVNDDWFLVWREKGATGSGSRAPIPSAEQIQARIAASHNGGAPEAPAGLMFLVPRFNFDKARPRQLVKAVFPVFNGTKSPINIERIEAGCGCVRVATKQLTWQPGQRRDLVLNVDVGAQTGKFTRGVFVYVAGAQVVPLFIEGVVQRPAAK